MNILIKTKASGLPPSDCEEESCHRLSEGDLPRFKVDPSCIPEIRPGHQPYVLFTEGDKLYDSMLADIARACDCIKLESYIFAADEMGWLARRWL